MRACLLFVSETFKTQAAAAKAKPNAKAMADPDAWKEFANEDEDLDDPKVKRAAKARQKKSEMKELHKARKGIKYPLTSLFV